MADEDGEEDDRIFTDDDDLLVDDEEHVADPFESSAERDERREKARWKAAEDSDRAKRRKLSSGAPMRSQSVDYSKLVSTQTTKQRLEVSDAEV